MRGWPAACIDLNMSDEGDAENLQRRVEELETRQRRLMELMGTPEPAKLEHDLRNLLNELNLLRKLADLEGEG